MGEPLRGGVRDLRQQHWEAIQIGAEAFEHRVLHIAQPEGDPLAEQGAADRYRLLEQRDAALLPEVVAEQKGGIGADGYHGGRQDLGPVVGPGRFLRIHLQMDLKGGGDRFHHYIPPLQEQLILALDFQGEWTTPT